ncbi:MAG: DNA helicase RecQ [Chloroflexi bacterium]|nr:DNA helicase RecQ [Chloroflexota bacterium]
MMNTPLTILKETFGYNSFRSLQQEVIENVLAHKDTLAIMPTGGGKSLCYQIPALIQGGLTVVVSPLIALMKDQVEQLRAYGVPAVTLNSSLSALEYQENMEYVLKGEVKILYVAPETLLTPRLQGLLSGLKLDLLTIDEAHCISEWGHDFRPEYRQLVEVRQRFPQATCLALTATATARVRQDIKSSLRFPESNEFVASFNRENLYIEVAPKENPIQQVLQFLKRYTGQSGIIYCFSRRQVDELAAYLAMQGHAVRPYHAGLEDDERRRNQEAFIRDDVQIIVATIAFGMGINKPNVRFVIHYDLPKSIEGYYQEIGRAGRDGLPAHCLLLYNYSDVAKQRYFVDQKQGSERSVAIQHLNALIRYAENEVDCRRKPLLAYFGEDYTAPNCHNCDNCNAAAPQLSDVTIVAQKFLSCVKRTGERFGAGYVTDVLLGSKAEKVLKNGHAELSTYGIGRELNRKQWMHLGRQLLQMGYLDRGEEYETLSLTRKATEALKARSPIFATLQADDGHKTGQAGKKDELEYNHALFALLRQKRKELADAAGIPPYVIFSDKTLVEMATYYPQSDESLLHISGVGQVKAQQYGPDFLEVIRPYCAKHHLAEALPDQAPKGKRRPGNRSENGSRTLLVAEAFNQGESIQDLAQRYGVTPTTIVSHLTRHALAGHPLRQGDEFQALLSTPAGEQERALQAFAGLGTEYLKPVHVALGGQISYDELKVLRLIYISRSG